LAVNEQRIILNGSFVTDIIEPNDVDCVLLFIRGGRRNRAVFKELQGGLPFLDVAIVGQEDFDKMVNKVFASDRHGVPKGMEVVW
jgi:hypothetical protein